VIQTFETLKYVYLWVLIGMDKTLSMVFIKDLSISYISTNLGC